MLLRRTPFEVTLEHRHGLLVVTRAPPLALALCLLLAVVTSHHRVNYVQRTSNRCRGFEISDALNYPSNVHISVG